jgi:ankyrin repeat protein
VALSLVLQACVNGHVAVVQQLLKAGADAAAANKEGRTPLDMAKNDQVKEALQQQGGPTL